MSESTDWLDEIITDLINAKQTAVRAAQSANEFAGSKDLVELANQLLERIKSESKSTILAKQAKAVHESFCWKQSTNLTACDRKKDHLGDHSWQSKEGTK